MTGEDRSCMICSTRADCRTCAARRKTIKNLMAGGMSLKEAAEAERRSRDPFNPQKLALPSDREIEQFVKSLDPLDRATLVERIRAA